MSKNKVVRKGVIAFAAASLIATTVGCSVPGTSDGAGGSSETVKIGVLAPLTGPSSADGTEMKQGAELIVDKLNADGGVAGKQVELEVYDVKDQSADSVSAAVTRLTSDSDIAAAFTGYASTTNFEIDMFAEAGIPYTLGGGPDQTAAIVQKDPEKYKLVWSIAPAYDGYGTALPALLEQWEEDGTYEFRNKTVYIIANDNPFSSGIATTLDENLKAKGWDVVGPDTVPFGDIDDWNAQLGRIRQADPSLILNLDHLVSNTSKFMTQFKQNPTDSLVFSQWAPNVPEFMELAGHDADGLLYNNALAPIPGTSFSDDIMTAYQEAFGEDAGTSATSVYEQIRLWSLAAEEVGDPNDREAVGVAFGKQETDIAFGRLKFDPETHLAMSGDDFIPTLSYQIQDAERKVIAPEKYAQSTFEDPQWTE